MVIRHLQPLLCFAVGSHYGARDRGHGHVLASQIIANNRPSNFRMEQPFLFSESLLRALTQIFLLFPPTFFPPLDDALIGRPASAGQTLNKRSRTTFLFVLEPPLKRRFNLSKDSRIGVQYSAVARRIHGFLQTEKLIIPYEHRAKQPSCSLRFFCDTRYSTALFDA